MFAIQILVAVGMGGTGKGLGPTLPHWAAYALLPVILIIVIYNIWRRGGR